MVDIKTCKQCGHQWVSRIENPRACPSCKMYSWNIMKIKKEDKYDNNTKLKR